MSRFVISTLNREDIRDEKGLVICGYELAFIANIFSSYLLENNESIFSKKDQVPKGIYHDSGVYIMATTDSNDYTQEPT